MKQISRAHFQPLTFPIITFLGIYNVENHFTLNITRLKLNNKFNLFAN